MKEHFVTSLAWSERLRKAGVEQVSEFYWVKWKNQYDDEKHTVFLSDGSQSVSTEIVASAFLSDELAGMLPKQLHGKLGKRSNTGAWLSIDAVEDGGWVCCYGKDGISYLEKEADTLPNALAAMVEYCRQKGLI